MLSNQEMYLSLDDISIVPAVTTSIKHRSECNIYYENYGEKRNRTTSTI